MRIRAHLSVTFMVGKGDHKSPDDHHEKRRSVKCQCVSLRPCHGNVTRPNNVELILVHIQIDTNGMIEGAKSAKHWKELVGGRRAMTRKSDKCGQ